MQSLPQDPPLERHPPDGPPPVVHPLAVLIADAAAGRFPAVDGGWRRGVNGLGGAHDPRVIVVLAGPDAWIDSQDVLLTGRGSGAAPAGAGLRLVERPDLAAHHRALFAARIRDRPRVLGYPDRRRSAVVVFSGGLAGLTEIGFELEPERRGSGGGPGLIRDALSSLPAGQLVVAAVAPGNAASLRAAMTAGFSPIGSMQLFRRARS